MKAATFAAVVFTTLACLVVLVALQRSGVDLRGIDLIHDVMPWFMSAITLWMTHLQGRKSWKAWAFGLVNQLLWLAFAISTQTWGLLPLNAGLWILYVRNLRKWYDDEAQYLLRQQQGAGGE